MARSPGSFSRRCRRTTSHPRTSELVHYEGADLAAPSRGRPALPAGRLNQQSWLTSLPSCPESDYEGRLVSSTWTVWLSPPRLYLSATRSPGLRVLIAAR